MIIMTRIIDGTEVSYDSFNYTYGKCEYTVFDCVRRTECDINFCDVDAQRQIC